MFKYVAFLNFLNCTVSWLQLTGVCSGLTCIAVGVGQMLSRALWGGELMAALIQISKDE